MADSGDIADSDDIVLPPWQPDHVTSSCSICGTPFTFLNRRHHCRRCGRLVCATCSPHRITIPRQYIVRPPEERLWEEDHAYTRPRSSTDASYVDNLGGGETVRVCNPCVPDPNYGPPPQHENAASSPPPQPVPPPPPLSRSRASTYASDARLQGSSDPRDVSRTEPSAGDEVQRIQSSSVPYHRSHSSSAPYGQTRSGMQTNRALQNMPQTQRMRTSTSGYRTRSDDSYASSRHHHFNSLTHAGMPSAFDAASLAPIAQGSHRPKSRDTTRSNEEDECPVCGTRELPFGHGGTASDREQHVEQCLINHFAFSAGPSTRVVPTTADGPPTERPLLPIPPGTSPTPSPAIRQRMLVYHATEKDCFDESGEPQECVICFEEFQPGEEMGRLECLCRFHRTCIRSWWAMKGPGSCPTHQLHG
ncbi:hypothetical protein AAFC00_000406 [Neodothiora populina]|uniref:RING-type E3 ubiquitin transferase n=1 Tax=Neodothiora populina TaxID=2781224 RepID=A0ABR3PCS4_9PEZI